MICFRKNLKCAFYLVLLIVVNTAHTQLFDDFSDGNFTFNPEWKGDTSQFKITSSSAIPPEMKPALQLDGEDADTSYLYLENAMISNTEWRFWIKLSFNTSANNFARVYLISDQPDLEGQLNGYFVQIGGSNDSISLYKQSGLNLEKIIAGTIAFTGNSTNVLRIKVNRDEAGNWSLFSDMEGGYNFEEEGTGFDNNFTTTSYFGFFCKYTSSNSTKFYLDDIYVNNIIIDTIPPQLADIEIVSSIGLELYFNEPVELNSSQDQLHYFVDNGIGNPALAIRDLGNFYIVHLEFQQAFIPGFIYNLFVSGVKDLSGNIMQESVHPFVFEEADQIYPYDVVINEVMADVNPIPPDLPEADYLELYNRTNFPVNLEFCTLKPRVSSDPIILPSVVIQPDSFLIVVKSSDVEDFEQYGQVVGISGFDINNEGEIVLRNQQGNLIHAISYEKQWYQDEIKEEGGWSLEQIDPSIPCIGLENWKAAENVKGGTPGSGNSVNGSIFSLLEIISVQAITNQTIRIIFSHFMDSVCLANEMAYLIDQGIGFPDTVVLDEIFYNTAELHFNTTFQTDNLYQLIIYDTLYNCTGDFIELHSNYNFILPLQGQPFDIVINEIMADPDPPRGLPEFEYIELFNTTSSFLRMSGWKLLIGSSEKPLPDIVMEPQEYIIITENEATDLFGLLARTFGFPGLGLTNSGTVVNLIDEKGELISCVNYRSDWYLDFDKAEGGWSLEQIDPLNPCPGQENWRASEDDRGGSPGTINSIDAVNMVEPLLQKVVPVNPTTIEVYFNQLMDSSSLTPLTSYTFDKGIGNPSEVHIDIFDIRKVILVISPSLQSRTVYTLSLSQDIKSCIGISVPENYQIEFGMPEQLAQNDILINEVLFNPMDDGVDFVEIYNNSEKIIDLSAVQLGSIEVNQFSPNDTLYKVVSEENQLLLPGDFLVLSKDALKVQEQYYTQSPENFLDMVSFPVYNNDQGSVVVSGANHVISDAFTYQEEMHHPLLNSYEGVSLERINYNRPSYDITNWHSASEEVGFATPGYKNSQYHDEMELENEITIEPEIFSPDNDGYNDILNIHYKFGNSGYMGNITIFDAKGRLTKYLVSNSLLGTEGTFSWDGRTENDQKASIGIYIIYFEAFDTDGNIKKYKRTAVLGGKIW